jgi:GDPmannose 4,6-dehydratase
MKKTALIIGGLGQDGIELSLFLQKKNYEVISLIKKKKNIKNFQLLGINFFLCKIENTTKIISIIEKFKPSEIYNFAGITTIKETEENILLNDRVNSTSFLSLLNSLAKIDYKGKVFQSLSAEVFGDYNYKRINVKTNFNPINPYAIAKLSSYYYARYFRSRFKLKIFCGFLFNHDSKFNKKKHLIYYLVNKFKEIDSNKIKNFKVKNIASKRDWNLATDFVKKIWNEVQKKRPCDFILRSGTYNTVEDAILITAKLFNLSIIKKNNNGEIIFLNSKTRAPIIYAKQYDEKSLISKNNLKEIRLIRKDKLLRIIKNIATN